MLVKEGERVRDIEGERRGRERRGEEARGERETREEIERRDRRESGGVGKCNMTRV